MKRKLFIALILGVSIVACQKDKSEVTPSSTSSQTSYNRMNARRFSDTTDTLNSGFIPVGVANTMISSYLYSINSSVNDTDIQSFSINADSLRAYLANPSIKNVKLMFAHTMAYINAGNTGVPAGYQSGAITIVIAGYDSNGGYVYYTANPAMGNAVLDHAVPCPYTCPPGNAGYNLLQ